MKLVIALVAVGMIAGTADAAPCRNQQTKRFIKCPPAASAAATPTITKDAKGRCHLLGGKFTTCPK